MRSVMNISWKKKQWIAFRLSISGNGRKKAQYLKSLNLFKEFGENNFWYSRVVPTDMELISVHNNVKVATDVYFCTHDVLQDLFNDDPNLGGDTLGIPEKLFYMIMFLLGQNPQSCMA